MHNKYLSTRDKSKQFLWKKVNYWTMLNKIREWTRIQMYTTLMDSQIVRKKCTGRQEHWSKRKYKNFISSTPSCIKFCNLNCVGADVQCNEPACARGETPGPWRPQYTTPTRCSSYLLVVSSYGHHIWTPHQYLRTTALHDFSVFTKDDQEGI